MYCLSMPPVYRCNKYGVNVGYFAKKTQVCRKAGIPTNTEK